MLSSSVEEPKNWRLFCTQSFGRWIHLCIYTYNEFTSARCILTSGEYVSSCQVGQPTCEIWETGKLKADKLQQTTAETLRLNQHKAVDFAGLQLHLKEKLSFQPTLNRASSTLLNPRIRRQAPSQQSPGFTNCSNSKSRTRHSYVLENPWRTPH